jgi:hypothetical protein
MNCPAESAAFGIKEAAILWGAFIGTASLTWQIVNFVRDRPRFTVHCSVWDNYLHGDGKEHEGPGIGFTVTNVGTKKGFVDGFSGQNPDGRLVSFTPFERVGPLEPGEGRMVAMKWIEVLRPGVKSLWVGDSLGRRYHVSRQDLKEIRQHLGRKGFFGQPERPVDAR